MNAESPPAQTVRCTVVVPTYNRATLLADCLDALLTRTVASEPFEIVAVDDGSTDETADVLERFGDRVRAVQRIENGGFARACNDGAATAKGDLLVFLNNDALPSPGWLGALLSYADAHAEAGIVGTVLLFPDGSVQHAGVAIGLDGYPRHLYAGFPADHPAIARPRACQAVTAASLLVRRAVFEAVGGFDTGYRNGFEDVDLCLQARALGWEVHVCPESVAMHLESVSPGRFYHDGANVARFRQRWGDRLKPDELDHYVADGLLRVEHDATYPLRLWISPHLGVVSADTATLDGLLAARSRQVHALLRALIEERVRSGRGSGWAEAWEALSVADEPPAALHEHRRAWEADAALEARIAAVDARIAAVDARERDTEPARAGGPLAYRAEVARARHLLAILLPPDAVCLVVSRGDPDLLDLGGCQGWHFPLDLERETYAGYHPADSTTAVEHLQALRQRGATHLAIPNCSRWWLREYPGLRDFLRKHARLILDDEASALLYALACVTDANRCK